MKELFFDGNNMTKEELLPVLAVKMDKKSVLQLAKKVGNDAGAVRLLLDISFSKKSEVAFRAAWVLEHCLYCFPENVMLNLPYFFDVYAKQKNSSCQRHFTKILLCLIEKSRDNLPENYCLEPIVETSFEWLINPKTPVAVQVNCLDILFYLIKQYDWVEDELRSQIVFLLKGGSAALQSRGKKILKKLNRLPDL